jgi:elongation factor G
MKPVTYVISVPLIPPDAIAARNLRAAIDEMCAADPTLGVTVGPVNEIVLRGQSEPQLDSAVDILKRGRGLAFQCGAPQVHYREAITKTIEWDYTHKRQTGGTGEYAKVKIRFEPGAPGSGFRFANKAGNAVPAVFVPAVEKGLVRACGEGSIAGLPVPLTDIACTLIDGGYHDIDSSEQTFEIAARACLLEAKPKVGPRILEPMMRVVVLTPQEYMGDVIGDLNSRRGQVQGMDSRDDRQEISALVPLANLFGYPTGLRVMTRGGATCTITFEHYEPIPPNRPGGDDNFPMAAALRW